MSYPPYQPPGNPPYPGGQPPYPGGNPPYPNSNPANPPYPGAQPPYPGGQPYGGMPYPQQNSYPGVFPPSLGFSVNAPMYMPAPSYPPSAPSPNTTNQGEYQNYQNTNYGGGPAYAPNVQENTVREVKTYTPTVRPANPFNPREDAEILRKAMKGFGTDEKAIIQVLTKRTNAQRLEIAVQFKTLYGKDLIKDLKSETSGRFEDLLVAMMTPLPQFYAKELHDAMDGIGTDEDVLIEVLCSMTNNEIKTICAAYQQLYFRSLEDDLVGDTSGTFKRLLVSLCSAGRDESNMTNPASAAADAQALLQAGVMRFGTDESTFNMVLCQRNYAQLELVFNEYQRLSGHDIEEAIKAEFSGDCKDGFLAVIRCIRNRPAFFAKRLYNSMAGMGTTDRQLIRILVTRCEVDMVDIKMNYQAKYGKSLKDAIADDTSGDYKKCLLGLIGEY